MSRRLLILTDVLFIIGIALLYYATDGFEKKGMLMLIFLMIFGFASCVKRHADYYKQTKRFY